jgi:hypothetical protein
MATAGAPKERLAHAQALQRQIASFCRAGGDQDACVGSAAWSGWSGWLGWLGWLAWLAWLA